MWRLQTHHLHHSRRPPVAEVSNYIWKMRRGWGRVLERGRPEFPLPLLEWRLIAVFPREQNYRIG